MLKIKGGGNNEEDIDIKTYMKYLLREGSMTEKREILSCIKSRVVIKNKVVSVEK